MSAPTFFEGDRVSSRVLESMCAGDIVVAQGTGGTVTDVTYTHAGSRVVSVLWDGREHPIGYGPGAVDQLTYANDFTLADAS